MAVYTQLSSNDIDDFLAQYDIGTLGSFEPIAEGVTNTNYLIHVIPSEAEGSKDPSTPLHSAQDDTEKYILTLFEKHFELAELPYFTALMGWWYGHGISCPQPIAMRDGRTLSALKEKPALLVSFLQGSGVENITLEHMPQLGKLVADMHIAGMEFPHQRENGLSLKGWEAIIDRIVERLDEIEPGLKQLVSEEYNYLSEHWPSTLPKGPVHADLFPDNVFFSKQFGKQPKLTGVIDFYFSCHEAWAYDLAIVVNAWCFDARHRLVKERVQALMAAYNEVRPISAEEETVFTILLRGAALRFLLTRADAWLNRDEGALVATKDPLEYAAKLRFFQDFKL